MSPVYFVLLLLTLGHFLVDFMIGILPVYKTMMNFDLAKAGMIAGGCAFIGEGVQVIFGPLGDRGYRKLLAIAGILAAAASTFFAYAEDDYLLVGGLYLITCLGSGAFHPSAASIISRLTVERKSLFIAIFATGGALGLATSQLIFSETYEMLEGNTAILAIPTVLLVFYMMRQQISASQPTINLVSGQSRFSLFMGFYKQPYLRNLYFLTLCNQTIAWAVIFLLPDVLRMKGYDEWVYFGGGHLCFVIGSGLMMIPAGILSDKYSPKFVLIAAVAMSVTTLYVFLLSGPLPIILLCSILAILGAAIGLVSPVAVAFGNQLMPSHPGIVNACLMGLVWCFAECIGQTGGGMLTKLFDENAPRNALLILGSLFVPGMLAGSLLPRTADEVNPDYQNRFI